MCPLRLTIFCINICAITDAKWILCHDQCWNQWRKRVFGNLWFPNTHDPHSYGSWDKRQIPYSSRNDIIPNLATAGAPETGLGPHGSWALTVASLGIMWFLNGYGFLLSDVIHDEMNPSFIVVHTAHISYIYSLLITTRNTTRYSPIRYCCHIEISGKNTDYFKLHKFW